MILDLFPLKTGIWSLGMDAAFDQGLYEELLQLNARMQTGDQIWERQDHNIFDGHSTRCQTLQTAVVCKVQELLGPSGRVIHVQGREVDRLGFSVGLSHDGPGYHARGADPLDDPQKRAAIFDLYARLKPEGRISINAMIHANNPSRAHVQAWLRERFGEDVVIGEGAFIDPYDEGGLASTFQTSDERVTFSAFAFKELRAGAVTSFDIGRKKIMDFVESVAQGRPASAMGQKCGMDRTDNLAVDLNGNVLTCQNVSAAAVAPNGESHKIGHISQLQAVKMRSATHWSKRDGCSNCPVLQLCKGSCMFLDGPLWTAGCDASYSDNVPFLAAGIEFLTGSFPFYIEGDFPQERRDIFGLVSEHSEAKEHRVIPIKVEHA